MPNAGEPEAALTALNRATELRQWPSDTSFLVGVAYALKKENDHALEWLDKAVKLGFSDKDSLKNDPRLNSLRDDPRFKTLLEKNR